MNKLPPSKAKTKKCNFSPSFCHCAPSLPNLCGLNHFAPSLTAEVLYLSNLLRKFFLRSSAAHFSKVFHLEMSHQVLLKHTVRKRNFECRDGSCRSHFLVILTHQNIPYRSIRLTACNFSAIESMKMVKNGSVKSNEYLANRSLQRDLRSSFKRLRDRERVMR